MKQSRICIDELISKKLLFKSSVKSFNDDPYNKEKTFVKICRT